MNGPWGYLSACQAVDLSSCAHAQYHPISSLGNCAKHDLGAFIPPKASPPTACSTRQVKREDIQIAQLYPLWDLVRSLEVSIICPTSCLLPLFLLFSTISSIHVYCSQPFSRMVLPLRDLRPSQVDFVCIRQGLAAGPDSA